jgi:hypothetical protein
MASFKSQKKINNLNSGQRLKSYWQISTDLLPDSPKPINQNWKKLLTFICDKM